MSEVHNLINTAKSHIEDDLHRIDQRIANVRSDANQAVQKLQSEAAIKAHQAVDATLNDAKLALKEVEAHLASALAQAL